MDLSKAENTREAGIHMVYSRLVSNRLKIFKTCPRLLGQVSIYRRNEKGQVVKEMDDLVDALRYMVVSGPGVASYPPIETGRLPRQQREHGRSAVTGY